MTKQDDKKKTATDRLADLKNNLPPLPPKEEPKAPAGGTEPPAGEGGSEGPGNGATVQIDPEEAANAIISYADDFCKEAGLSPLNVMQRLLVRVGIVGSCKKYNISLDFDKYPEAAVLLGAAWVTVDKIKEYKKLHAKEEEPEKKEPAAAPAPGSAEPVKEGHA